MKNKELEKKANELIKEELEREIKEITMKTLEKVREEKKEGRK